MAANSKPRPVAYCARCEEPTTIAWARCGKRSCEGTPRTALADDDWKSCPECTGIGEVDDKSCPVCKGHGHLLIRQGTMSAKIGRNY